MKKTYITPEIEIIEIRKPSLLAGSIIQKGDNLSVSFSDDDFEEGETIN